MIEPTGYTALDLVGFTDKGTYAANVNYVKNDLVHYGGSIWRILIDDTIGITPAEGPNYTLYIGEPTNLVERIIAPLEDNPATVAYQTGRQIIYNDYLYEVIDDIAVGDILIAYEDDPTNANIKLASPVETQVLALNASKVNKSDVVNNVTTTTAGKVLDARQGKALQDGKTDNSVIAPVESGTTASRAYAVGAHFIRDSAFCTAKTAIAQGEAFTLNTNYTAGDVGARVAALENIIFPTITLSFMNFDSVLSTHAALATRVGNIVHLKIIVKINGSVNFNSYNFLIVVNGISIYRVATTVGYLESMGYPIDFNISPYEEGILFQSIPNNAVGVITSGYLHIGTTLICK